MNSYLKCFVLPVVLVLSQRYVIAQNGFFWHVTDFHYDPTYWSSQLTCFESVSSPGPFGDYSCDPPWRLVADTIQNMAVIKPDVDFILWTGDSVAHIKDEDISLEMNMAILENVTNLLNQLFPPFVKFYPSLGNHDFYPRNQAGVVEDEMYLQTNKIWELWIDNEKQLKRFLHGGFYYKEIHKGLRLLALNTNLYYTKNKITQNMADPAGQFQWMDEVLTQARQNGEKVIITGHVPPGVKTPKMADLVYPHHEESLVQLLTKFSDIIVSSHYGHAHADGFKIVQQNTNTKKAIAQFVAPSVTPYQTRNTKQLTGYPHNPGIRLVEYERATGHHINYIQYYLNLTNSNRNNQSDWAILYSFIETYGVDDMSVKSLRNIFSEMAMEGGEALAQKYCNYYHVTQDTIPCPPASRWGIVCGGRLYKRKEAIECVVEHLENVTNGSAPKEVNPLWLIHPLSCFVIITLCYVSVIVFCQKMSNVPSSLPRYVTIDS